MTLKLKDHLYELKNTIDQNKKYFIGKREKYKN